MPLAAHYFLYAKRSAGLPIDPVARFHLGNRARLERIKQLAKPLKKNHSDANLQTGKLSSKASENAMNQNLFSIICSRLPADRSADFIITPSGQQYSYADLLQQSARFANTLLESGVKPGNRVAAQVDKSPEAIMLYLGTLRAGAVYLPLNTDYTVAELRYFLGDAEPAVFVCRPAFHQEATALGSECGVAHVETLGLSADGTLMDKAKKANQEFDDVDRSSDDLAAILYTSGTTGRSKGAMLSHGNLSSNALTLANHWHFSTADRLLHALPIFHTHGLFVACNVTLMAGSSLIFLPKFDVQEILRQLPNATVMMGVPTFYTRLLANPDFNRERVQHMRLFVSGSAPLTAETHKAFAERTGHAILERYGMTETNMNTSNPYDGERRAGTVGMPMAGIEVRITDPESSKENIKILPQGEIGMIEVRGSNVFKGYWRMPEKTREELRSDGFFITGDLGLIDEQGYLHIVGRGKDLIISGGYNVYPKEIEQLIDELPEAVESAVIGLPHPDFGEGVSAVIVPKGGTKKAGLDPKELIGALSGRLAKYKIPKRVFLVDELPRNSMGKVQKNLLRERYKETFTQNQAN